MTHIDQAIIETLKSIRKELESNQNEIDPDKLTQIDKRIEDIVKEFKIC
jgi:hypothetical protein